MICSQQCQGKLFLGCGCPSDPTAPRCFLTLGFVCTNSSRGEEDAENKKQRQESKSQLGMASPAVPGGDLPELVLAEVHGGHGMGAHGIKHGLGDLSSLLVTGTGVTPINHCPLINRAFPPSFGEDKEQDTGKSCRKLPALPHVHSVTTQDFFPPSQGITEQTFPYHKRFWDSVKNIKTFKGTKSTCWDPALQ